jgi:hypothetical protein
MKYKRISAAQTFQLKSKWDETKSYKLTSSQLLWDASLVFTFFFQFTRLKGSPKAVLRKCEIFMRNYFKCMNFLLFIYFYKKLEDFLKGHQQNTGLFLNKISA